MATGGKARIAGKTFTLAELSRLSDRERKILITTEKFLEQSSLAQRSKVGLELGLDRHPTREEVLKWMSMGNNVERAEHMIAKWWKRWLS